MGKIDDKPRPSDALLKGFTSSSNDNDSEHSQDPLSLKSMKKLQNHCIQAESGTPSNLVRTESSPAEDLMERMSNNQHGNYQVLVSGNGIKEFSPCTERKKTIYTELKKTPRKILGNSFYGTGSPSVKPNMQGHSRTQKVPRNLAIRKFVQGIGKSLSKKHGEVHICGIILKTLMAPTVMCTKPFETKWGFKIFGFLMFLLFSMASSTGVTEECQMATVKTVRKALKCPTNRTDWDTAANFMNCTALVPSHCTTLKYHCVVNGFGNATIEVCAETKYIQPKYCPEFNERGGQIQNRRNFSLKEIKEVYNSTNVYQYPHCFDILNTTKERSSAETVGFTNPAQTTVFSIHKTPSTNWRTEGYDSTNAFDRNGEFTVGILLGIILPFLSLGVVVGFLCMFMMCKRKRGKGNFMMCKRKRGQGNSTANKEHAEENGHEQKEPLVPAAVNGLKSSVEDDTADFTGKDGIVDVEAETDRQSLNGNPPQ